MHIQGYHRQRRFIWSPHLTLLPGRVPGGRSNRPQNVGRVRLEDQQNTKKRTKRTKRTWGLVLAREIRSSSLRTPNIYRMAYFLVETPNFDKPSPLTPTPPPTPSCPPAQRVNNGPVPMDLGAASSPFPAGTRQSQWRTCGLKKCPLLRLAPISSPLSRKSTRTMEKMMCSMFSSRGRRWIPAPCSLCC